ncbi:uncharacterized protein LOC111104168 isoform X3 [Crassostrea virginica]
MASSSVSQESLDIEDYEAISSRQSRVRRARAMMPKHCEDRETPRNGDKDSDCDVIPEHESPSRSSTAASRARDKRRPNHLHKGKLPKDKRKLREKRRSTGVVNLQSTESTGDSLDDEDDEDLMEAKKNTSYNEVIDADNPQTPAESRVPRPFSSRRSTKSPSDLEADLEDNQDYDSTVSQSETNLTLIGKLDHKVSSNQNASPRPLQGQTYGRSSNPPDIPKSFKNFSPYTSENETKTSPSYSSNSSSPSSVLNRYKWRSPEMMNQEREPANSGTGISSIISRYDKKVSEGDTNLNTGFGSSSYRNFGDRFRKDSPFQSQFRSVAAPTTREDTEKINLRKMLEKEQEENRKMKQMLEEKDRRIAELEREVILLNKEN